MAIRALPMTGGRTSRATLLALASLACIAALGLSCSDPVSPAPRGAAALQWAVSTLNSKTPQCVPGPHWSNAPVSSSNAPEASANVVTGGFVVNGRQGGTVMCSVVQQGQGYLVSGEIHSASPDGALWTDVGLSVTIDGENVAQGSLYVTDQVSQVAFSSDTAIVPPKPGCTVSIYAAESELGVAPGRVWASIQCPHMNDNRNRAAQECQIASGFIVLENCLRE
jgi:hypothetical protein